jgi:hypothetical protein
VSFCFLSVWPLCCEFEPRSWRDMLDTILCDKVCQWLAAVPWFSPGAAVSSSNKTERHDITEILLKVVLNTINQTSHHVVCPSIYGFWISFWYLQTLPKGYLLLIRSEGVLLFPINMHIHTCRAGIGRLYQMCNLGRKVYPLGRVWRYQKDIQKP